MRAATALLLLAVCTISADRVDRGIYGPLKTKVGLSRQAKVQILCLHNKLRSIVARGESDSLGYKKVESAADMQCLCWDEELAKTAQKHASNCKGPPHDKRSDRATSHFSLPGQNLMSTMKSSPIEESMSAFFEEINGYTLQNNDCNTILAGRAKVCGHYTALMWAKTQAIGCAYDACEGETNGRLVCNYGPGGNIVGQKPYTAGKACTKCMSGQSCWNGALCCSCAGSRCKGNVTAAQTGSKPDLDPRCPAFKAAGYCTNPTYGPAVRSACPGSCSADSKDESDKFCLADLNTIEAEICSPKLGDEAPECMNGKGINYAGKVSKTEKGEDCIAWASDDPRPRYYHSFEFVDSSKTKAKNYCRNPGESGDRPWCYTATSWGYCSIPTCTK